MIDRIVLREVGPRDGLQQVADFLPTDTKIEWCRAQAACGFAEIEATSFVPPSVLPQFADAAEVLAGANGIDGLLPSVLAVNLKGAVRAMNAGARKINFVVSVSDAHSRSNVRKSTEDALDELRAALAERDARGLPIVMGCGLATTFGCSIDGAVPLARVRALAARVAALGVDEITLADTVGYANPVQVRETVAAVGGEAGGLPLSAHFHDTRGMGLANVVAAVEGGVRHIDASLGGLGGCPFAPGATGNIATEDTVYLLESMGLDTGIDLDAVLALRARLPEWLPTARIEGRLAEAGPAKSWAGRQR